MSDKLSQEAHPAADDLRVGSWLGAAACAFGLGACITVVTLGGMQIMDAGGYVASGGPYQIAHPVPRGFWIQPVAFIGIWMFLAAHGFFASRIKGFWLVYATWCALWTSVGATTLWYGFNPPQSDGLAWGWLVMGGVFLLVGLSSTWVYVHLLTSKDREPSAMPSNQRAPYAVMISAALAAGVVAGFQVLAAVAG
jgi:hypothetical protein